MRGEIKYKASKLERCGLLAFYNALNDPSQNRSKYNKALEIFNKRLRVLHQFESSPHRTPVHKGPLYYYIGRTYLFKDERHNAISNFLKSYVEDVLLEFDGKMKHYYANDGAAYKILNNFYKVMPEAFHRLRERCRKYPDCKDAQEILNGVGFSKIKARWIRSFKRWPYKDKTSKLGFPEDWEKRVFIGGPHKRIQSLVRIKDAVAYTPSKPVSFTPIIANEVYFGKDEKEVHDKILLLIHTCKYAIFEITEQAGQLLELERTRDYNNKVLALYTRSPKYSGMLKGMDWITIKHYTEGNLDNIVKKFLLKKDSA